MAVPNTPNPQRTATALCSRRQRASRYEIYRACIPLAMGVVSRSCLCSTSRHYRKPFDAKGVCISLRLPQLPDLAKFPFTVKNDLRDNYPFHMFAVPREKLVRSTLTSSGTRPSRSSWSAIPPSRHDNRVGRGLSASIRAAGCPQWMSMHNRYGYWLFTGGLGAH